MGDSLHSREFRWSRVKRMAPIYCGINEHQAAVLEVVAICKANPALPWNRASRISPLRVAELMTTRAKVRHTETTRVLT